MNKDTFLGSPPVKQFLAWAASQLAHIPIHLHIRQSRFVPAAINVDFTGVLEVLPFYAWRATGMTVGDWTETATRVSGLSAALRDAVNLPNDAATLEASKDILSWGGNRDWTTGAFPFLDSKQRAGVLSTYLDCTRALFRLDSADTSSLAPVSLMNAMLTKVQAFLAVDGLPIYDSRVAAAIATFVEVWRRSAGLSQEPLPDELVFPATMRTRTVLKRFPDAISPPVLVYGAPTTAREWSSAKIRLGWILQSLCKAREVSAVDSKMREWEAALFMLGYDVSCIDITRVAPTLSTDYRNRVRALLTPTEPVTGKSLKTLSHRGTLIIVRPVEGGNCEIGWGSLVFFLDASVIEDIEIEFGGREVPLGAAVDGNVPQDSLGQWLLDNGWPSRRYASAIAPVLVDLGVIQNVTRPRGFVLHFR